MKKGSVSKSSVKKVKKEDKKKKTKGVGKKKTAPVLVKEQISRKEVETKIKSIIAEVMEIDEKKITPKTRFFEDLGMDSMMALEILAMIEKAFKIEITEEDLPKIVSYNAVIKLTMDLSERKKT